MAHISTYVNRLTKNNWGEPGVSHATGLRYSRLGEYIASTPMSVSLFSETPGIRFSRSAEFFSAKKLNKTLFGELL